MASFHSHVGPYSQQCNNLLVIWSFVYFMAISGKFYFFLLKFHRTYSRVFWYFSYESNVIFSNTNFEILKLIRYFILLTHIGRHMSLCTRFQGTPPSLFLYFTLLIDEFPSYVALWFWKQQITRIERLLFTTAHLAQQPLSLVLSLFIFIVICKIHPFLYSLPKHPFHCRLVAVL